MIDKFQSGGIFRSMVYQPLPMMPGPDASQPLAQGVGATGTQEQTVEETIPKELIKELLGNGITNDVVQFKEEVDNAYANYSRLSDLEKNTQYGRHLRSVMKGDFSKLNNLKRNKDLLDKGLDTVKANQAESDYAITNNGVIIKDLKTGLVGEVSHNEFATKYRDNENFKMLTNAELVAEREYNKNLTFDTRSLTALSSSIGITKVKEEVLKVLDKLGKQSNASAQQMLTFGNPSQVSSGANELLKSGVEGFYKEGVSSERSTNADNVNLAIETMWVNLSENARSLLKARAVAKGASGAQIEKVAREDAISILKPSYEVSSSNEYTIDFDASATNARLKSKEDKEGGGPLGEVGFWNETLRGVGDPKAYEIEMGGNRTTVIGNTAGTIQDYGEDVKPGTMLSDIQSLKTMSNSDYAVIGNNVISSEQMQNVMYKGRDMAMVEVPVKKDEKGRLIPDLEANKSYQKAVREVMAYKKSNPKASAAALSKIIQDNGYMPTKDAQGNIVPLENKAYFYVTDVVVNDAVLKDKTKDLNKVSKQQREQYMNYYKKGANNTKGEGENIVGRDSFNHWWERSSWFGRDVYDGVVFIPAGDNPLNMKKRALRADGMNALTPKANLDTQNTSSVVNRGNYNINNISTSSIGSKYKND